MDDRKVRERDFHDARFGAEESRKADRFYSIAGGSVEGLWSAIGASAPGKRVLDYGCGTGATSYKLAELGAHVTGIDISPVAIEVAERGARERGLDIDFRAMDAEQLAFDSGMFDVVCGSGILHHLDLERAYGEIARVLKSDGRAIFSEPLGHNAVINAYRDRTPDQRTDDEHPLLVRDFRLARNYFSHVDVQYYHLATLAAIPFCDKPYVGKVAGALDALDRIVFAVAPPLRRYAWLSVFAMRGPRLRESAA